MDLEGDLYSEEHYRIVFFGLQVDGFITWGGGVTAAVYGISYLSMVLTDNHLSLSIYMGGEGERE